MIQPSYSILKKLITRISIVSIITLIVSGIIIGVGFINDMKEHGYSSADTIIDELLSESFEHVYWVFGLSFLLIIIINYFLVKNSFKDVNKISEDIAKANINDPEEIVIDHDVPKEILPLVNSLNASFVKIKKDVEQQKEFISNASHELNTPIAILRANIEGMETSKQKEDLMNDLTLLEKVSSQLLRLSQVDQFKVRADESADLIEVAHQAVQLFDKEKARLHIHTFDEKEVWINGSENYLLIALRNLLENALFNSPANTPIDIRVYKNGSITVSNTKQDQALTQDKIDQIFEKFWRLNKNKYVGAGLGLSIVKRIAEAHHAPLHVDLTEEIFNIYLQFKPFPATK
jgi:signal transduction histidine kinase